MKYWIIHIGLITVILSAWLLGYNGYFTGEVGTKMTEQMLMDTILYEIPIERDVVDTLYISPSMMMTIPDSTDTLPRVHIPMEPEPVIVRRQVIDTIYDTTYVRVPIQIETQPKSASILGSVEVMVTIICGMFNIILGIFQMKDRKKN